MNEFSAATKERIRLARRVRNLEACLTRIVQAWDSIPWESQVPEELNIDGMWTEARRLVGLPPRDPEV